MMNTLYTRICDIFRICGTIYFS